MVDGAFGGNSPEDAPSATAVDSRGTNRRCVDSALVDAAYAAVRIRAGRAPRAFVVIGMEFSAWPAILAATFVLLCGIATAHQEREAERARAELIARNAELEALATDCLGDEAMCEGVVQQCTQLLAGSAACACWRPETP